MGYPPLWSLCMKHFAAHLFWATADELLCSI